ncbi:MAG: sulfotransferase [Dyella sp.]
MQEILTALSQGQPLAAEAMARTWLQGQPGHAVVQHCLAVALHQQGRQQEAADAFERLVELSPESGEYWSSYAVVLGQAGHLEQAELAHRRAVALQPEHPDRLLNFGLYLLHMGRHEEASEVLLKAHENAPASAEIRIHAANACAIARDYRANILLGPWRLWEGLSPTLRAELAELLAGLGDGLAAMQLYEDLLQDDPDNQPIRLKLAGIYERVNQLQAAEQTLQHYLRAVGTPDDLAAGDVAHLQATLLMRRGQVTEAAQLLERTQPRPGHDYAHFFALAAARDRLTDTRGALSALAEAHRLQVEELKLVAPERFAVNAPLLPDIAHRLSEQDVLRWPTLESPLAVQSPVFIVGFPRSGTTLLEQMLDAHPLLQSMDEQPFFNVLAEQLESHGLDVPRDLHRLGQADCDELRRGYLSMVCGKIQRRWEAQLVDKNPMNLSWLPLIYRLFPQAKFILALRHPCDVLLSNYMQNFRAPVLAYACSSFERLAEAYVLAMQTWLHHVEVFKPQVYVSRYEDLVERPQEGAANLARFLGLKDAAPLLDFHQHARNKGYIATPSYSQVIQPLSNKAVGRWHAYREALEPVLPVLQPMLDHWGYGTKA